MRIKKAGILIIAAAITCTTPAVPAMAADTSESVQEIISDNEIDSLVSDPDKVVDIIMYVKNQPVYAGFLLPLLYQSPFLPVYHMPSSQHS